MRAFKVLVIAALLLAPAAAYAGDATLTWTAPTQRTDDTALDNLAGYRVLWGTASRSYTQSAVVNDPATLTYFVDGLPDGLHYFAVTAFDADGLESGYSAEVSKEISTPTAPPNPPGSLVVLEDSLVAYTVVQTADRFALVPVGTVPAGTACDGAQFISDGNGVSGYVVPKDAVDYAGSVRPQVVVASCG